MTTSNTQPSLEHLAELVQQLDSASGPVAAEFFEATAREIKRLAKRQMRRERIDHTWRTTELMQEFYVRIGGRQLSFETLGHFFAVATKVMQNALKDHARRRAAQRRPPPALRTHLDDAIETYDARNMDVERVQEAMAELREQSEMDWLVADLHHFGGLTHEEVAASLGLKPSQVKAKWALAKRRLRKVLSEDAR